jgi:hypothetical protein
MRRSRFGRPMRTKTKTKKIRPTITMKEKPARRNGTCAGCGGAVPKGEVCNYVRHAIRRYHIACTPANVLQPVAAKIESSLPTNPVEAKKAAMLAVENAWVVMIQKGILQITPEMEKVYTRYNSLKAHALNPSNANEQRQAMKVAMLDLVKIVFG